MADAEAESPLTAEDKERLRVAIIRAVAGLDGYENPSTDADGWWDRRVWPVRRAVLATLDAARSRPATDPAGLDENADEAQLAFATQHLLDHLAVDAPTFLCEDKDNVRRFAAKVLARLSVGDGLGPEERPDLEAAVREWVAAEDGVHGTDPAPSREAWDRAFAARAALRAALPVHREETGHEPGPRATILVEDQERPLIWIEGRQDD